MAGIDCDPATSDEAQQNIQAAQFFTKANYGLKQEWRGRLWLNPPYAKKLTQLAQSEGVGSGKSMA